MKEGWTYKSFEDYLLKAAKAKQVQTSDYNSGSQYPIISQEDKMISGYCDDASLLYHIDTPIVIFGDHTRVLKYVDFDFVVGADGVKILIPKDFLKAKYMFYYLRWYNVPSLGYSRHYKLLKEITLPVPPLSILQSIVSELDMLSGLIAKHEEQLKAYDELAQSIFYDMFGDPVENEKGWDYYELSEIYKFIDYRGKTPNKTTDGVPLITAKNIRKGNIDYSVDEYISESEHKNRLTRGIPRKGDLLFTTEAPLGNAAIADIDYYATAQRLIVLQRKDKVLLHNIYVLYYILSDTFQEELLKNATGSTIKGIKASKLEKLKIPLPPLSLQTLFAEKIEAIERQKERIRQSIAEVKTLFDSRMDYYFNSDTPLL
ncbi:MAG: restriction endonuclease subunit S [Bacteroidales bacterium]|nr:restriction endonuclease subunit S [Bacteroidales bacterium]